MDLSEKQSTHSQDISLDELGFNSTSVLYQPDDVSMIVAARKQIKRKRKRAAAASQPEAEYVVRPTIPGHPYLREVATPLLPDGTFNYKIIFENTYALRDYILGASSTQNNNKLWRLYKAASEDCFSLVAQHLEENVQLRQDKKQLEEEVEKSRNQIHSLQQQVIILQQSLYNQSIKLQ